MYAIRSYYDIAEQMDENDGQPPDRDQGPGQVTRLPTRQPGRTEQRRHRQIVADHCRQRDGLDDDHAGRRRQSADESEQDQGLGTVGQRQGQYEGIRIVTDEKRFGKPAQRQRQDEA